jgi:uncharacterized protein (TIGR00730 family)
VTAYHLGGALAKAGFTVCNGGYGGIMEASARGAKDAGGQTIGVVTKAFGRGAANKWIDRVVEVDTLVERLQKLISIGDAYVVLKGGTGTLLELAAVWEFMNKGMIDRKPVVVIGGFWNDVVKTLKEELTWEGLADCTRFVSIVDTPTECTELLKHTLDKHTIKDKE